MTKPNVNHDNLNNIAEMCGLDSPITSVLTWATELEALPFIGWPEDIDSFMDVVQATYDTSNLMFVRFPIDNKGEEVVAVIWKHVTNTPADSPVTYTVRWHGTDTSGTDAQWLTEQSARDMVYHSNIQWGAGINHWAEGSDGSVIGYVGKPKVKSE